MRIEWFHERKYIRSRSGRDGDGSVVTGCPGGYICLMGFGVGPGEIILVAVLFLLLFGPSKLPQMARDIGRFVNEARRSMDEFKSELTSGVDDDDEDDERKKTSLRKKR